MAKGFGYQAYLNSPFTYTQVSDADCDAQYASAVANGTLTDGRVIASAIEWPTAVFNATMTAITSSSGVPTIWYNQTPPAAPLPLRALTAPIVLANGANSNVPAIGASNFARVTGPSDVFTVTGIAGGTDGWMLALYNTTAFAMTIVNDLTSTAANRILTTTGANIIIPASGIVVLVYSFADQRWIVVDVWNYSTTAIPVIVSAASGAIAIPSKSGAQVIITYNGGAGGYTLAAPTAGGAGVGQDGQIFELVTTTAQAHVITSSVDGFNAKGSSGTATWTAAIGNALKLLAYNGHWYAITKTGVTIA